MSNEMIERVARAIEVSLYGDNSGESWREWIEQAKAVIAAIREPTKEMIEEGCKQLLINDEAEYVFMAMIDAALKE